MRFLFLVIFISTLFANCNYIQDDDLKNLCKAETTNNPISCNYIKNHDKKYYCLAIVKEDKNKCFYIKDSDLKNYCLSKVVKGIKY